MKHQTEYQWVLRSMVEYERRYGITILQELWSMGVRGGEEVSRLVDGVMEATRTKEMVLDVSALVGQFRLQIERMRYLYQTNLGQEERLAS